jgi:hypothetical protein
MVAAVATLGCNPFDRINERNMKTALEIAAYIEANRAGKDDEQIVEEAIEEFDLENREAISIYTVDFDENIFGEYGDGPAPENWEELPGDIHIYVHTKPLGPFSVYSVGRREWGADE